jgi:hypothetical protein
MVKSEARTLLASLGTQLQVKPGFAWKVLLPEATVQVRPWGPIWLTALAQLYHKTVSLLAL